MSDRYDVLVAGAGMAGVTAAVAAARAGATTLLVESKQTPGGTGISGMHRHICGMYANDPTTPSETLNAGLTREVHEGLAHLAPSKTPIRMGRVYVQPFAQADLLSVLQTLINDEDSLNVLYGTRVTDLTITGNAVSAAALTGDRGNTKVTPRVVIDCTGQGNLLRISDTACNLTATTDRPLSGYAIKLKGLQDLDEDLAIKVPYYMRKAVDKKQVPAYLQFTTFFAGEQANEGICRLSIPPAENGYRTDQAQADAALVCQVLSDVLPPFSKAQIIESSPHVMDREGLRLRGKYTLTADDVLGARTFPDAIAKNAWPIEFWDQSQGPTYRYLKPGTHYEIPLRSLKSSRVRNLLCAGQCISVTSEALGSTRVMGCCMALGEAAGREAARSLNFCHFVS